MYCSYYTAYSVLIIMEDLNLEVQNIEHSSEHEYTEPYNCETFRQELTVIKLDSGDIIKYLEVDTEQIDKEHKGTCVVLVVSSIVCLLGFLCSYQYREELKYLVIVFTAVTYSAWWWTARRNTVEKKCMKDVRSIGSRIEKMLMDSRYLWQAYFEEGVDLLYQARDLSRSNQPLEPENSSAQGMFVCALFLRMLSTVVTLIVMVNLVQWAKLDDAKTMLDFGAMGCDLITVVAVIYQDVGHKCRSSQQITQSMERIRQLMKSMLLFNICLKESTLQQQRSNRKL